MEFKEHPVYKGYRVSQAGQVKGVRGSLIGSVRQDGYKYAWIASIKAFRYVHRLVWETYKGAIPEGLEINHKDGNKANCTLDNLELMTKRENVQHSYDVLDRKRYSGADSWNYGKEVTEETRQLMSDKKKGARHPKFKGWYVVNGEEYESTSAASLATGIHPKTIYRRCKDGHPGYSFTHLLK